MLTLAKIGAAGAAGYASYLASCEAHGDYYVNADGDPWAAPGAWLGQLAAILGVSGSATTADLLVTLMEGRDPRTGEELIRRGPKGDHVAAHDLTFSAPSSVTVLWAVGSPELRAAVQAAHEEAVSAAFSYVERALPLVRRRDPTRRREGIASPIINETAAAILGARFDHHTSRQTAAQAAAGLPPDPQLHSHVLLLGAQRRDGRVVAVDSLTLHRRRSEVGAVYRAELAARLARLGFPIQRGTGNRGRYFEVAGIPTELRDAWSSRHREIASRGEQFRQDFVAAFGRLPTEAEERDWAANTRAPKVRWHRGDIAERWRVMAQTYGVTPGSLDALRRAAGGTGSTPGETARQALVRELLGPQGVTAEHATFDLPLLRRYAFERAPGLLDSRDVESVLEELTAPSPSGPPAVVVLVAEAGVYTTAEMVELEHQVLTWRDARRKRAARDDEEGDGEQMNSEAWEAYLAGLSPVRLSGEQISAAQALLTGETFVPLTGEAGVGKSVVLGTFANAWRRLHGDAVVYAVAVSGHRAQEFARDLGTAKALTLDALVHRIKEGKLTLGPRDVVALDEAGQVETRRWAAFAQAVGDKATVLAVGDAGQRSPIGAGGLWEHLAEGCPRLTEVRRTRHAWEREAWSALRAGDARTALLRYAETGNLSVHGTRAAALEAAVDAWDRDGRGGLLVTDASNAERYRANLAAQTRRLRAGELGSEAVFVTTAQGPVGLRAGDRVIFRSRFSPVGADRIENGTAADVVAAQGGMLHVRTDRGAEVTMPASAAAGVLDLHYAAHVALAQGTTVDRAYVVAGGWQTDRESLYVQVSRSRDGSRIFLDRDSALGELGGSDVDALRAVADRVSATRAKRAAVTAALPRTTTRSQYVQETSEMPEAVPPARTAVRRVAVRPLMTFATPEITPQERAEFAVRMGADASLLAAPDAAELARAVRRTVLITPTVTRVTPTRPTVPTAPVS